MSSVTKPRVSDEVFVQAWLVSSNAKEVANATGLQNATVSARATRLRKLGVKLPKFERANKGHDVNNLNALIDKAIGTEVT